MEQQWVKSSFCADGGGVEVFQGPSGVVAIRTSDSPAIRLVFTPDEWEAFLTGVKAGDFDF